MLRPGRRKRRESRELSKSRHAARPQIYSAPARSKADRNLSGGRQRRPSRQPAQPVGDRQQSEWAQQHDQAQNIADIASRPERPENVPAGRYSCGPAAGWRPETSNFWKLSMNSLARAGQFVVDAFWSAQVLRGLSSWVSTPGTALGTSRLMIGRCSVWHRSVRHSEWPQSRHGWSGC